MDWGVSGSPEPPGAGETNPNLIDVFGSASPRFSAPLRDQPLQAPQQPADAKGRFSFLFYFFGRSDVRSERWVGPPWGFWFISLESPSLALRLNAIALGLEAIAIGFEAIAVGGHRS